MSLSLSSPEFTPESVALDVALLVQKLDLRLDVRHASLVALFALWRVRRVALEANVADPHWLVGEALVPHLDEALELGCRPVVVHVEEVELALGAGLHEFVDPRQGVRAVAEEVSVADMTGGVRGGTRT